MVKLTPKQEIFVQQLISGLSQRKAYRMAYSNSETWKDAVVDSKASTLFTEPKILERYRELLKENSNMALWTREQAFTEYEWLKNKSKEAINSEGIRQASANAFLGAIEGMNQMKFKDLELVDKKLALEIKRLELEVNPAPEQEDRLAEYMNAIKKAVSHD